MEGSEKQQLFGKLFGFKEGDRVKVETPHANGKGSYWRYGKVVHVYPNFTDAWAPLRVIFDDDKGRYRIGFAPKDLVRVRKYEKKIP